MVEEQQRPGGQPSLFEEETELEVERYGLEWEVRKGRLALFWAGGLMVLGDFIGMSMGGLERYPVAYIFGFDLVILSILVALGIWAGRKPVLALTIALVFYFALAFFMLGLFRVTADGHLVFDLDYLQFNLGALIIKGLLVYFLVKGLLAARKLHEMAQREALFRE